MFKDYNFIMNKLSVLPRCVGTEYNGYVEFLYIQYLNTNYILYNVDRFVKYPNFINEEYSFFLGYETMLHVAAELDLSKIFFKCMKKAHPLLMVYIKEAGTIHISHKEFKEIDKDYFRDYILEEIYEQEID